MTQSSFDPTLTQQDIDLTTEFMMYLADKHIEFFCSDNFREGAFHFRMADPAHEIGAYFAKLVANGVAEPVGELPSEVPGNHKRKVDLYRWNWCKWRSILKSRLP